MEYSKDYKLTNRISEYRSLKKITQQELADAVSVRRETIVNLERKIQSITDFSSSHC